MTTAEVQHELSRLGLAGEGASIASSEDGWRTPTASSVTEQDDGSANADSNNLSAVRWEKALQRCEKSLSKEDFKTVQQFDSPEKLLIGLDKLRDFNAQGGTAGVSSLVFQVYDTVRPFRDVLKIFMISMMPHSVTTGVVWGLTYLVIELSASQEAAARKFAEMLLRVRRQLAILKKWSSAVEDLPARRADERSELRLGLIDILEALIYFWRDCVHFFRSFPPAQFKPQETKEWLNIERSFAETMLKIDGAIHHLRIFLATDATAPSAQPSRATPAEAHDPDSRAVFPIHLLPDSKTTVFVGRDEILADMSRYLIHDAQARDELAVFTLCGLGGVGKSELAREYANRNKRDLDAILWVGAETAASLRLAFTRIAIELRLDGARVDGDPTHNLQLVHHWFRVTSRRWLLVLDNVEKYSDVEAYLPTESRGSVIVTTRYVDEAKRFQRRHQAVSKLTVSQAEHLFLKLLFPEQQQQEEPQDNVPANLTNMLAEQDKDALKYLLREMDGLVLGVQQMAALIRADNFTHNIAKFAERYKRHLPRLINMDAGTIKGHTLAKLWDMSFKKVRAEPDACTLMGVLCCLQPDGIPRELFLPSDSSITTGALAFCQDDFYVDHAINALRELALIERSGDMLSLHRLVQVAFLFELEPQERQTMFNAASALVNHAFPKQIKGRQLFEQRQQCQRWIQHGQALSGLFAKMRAARLTLGYTEPFVELMTNCAWYMYEAGHWRETLGLINIALDACEGKNDLARSHLLNTAAMTHFYLNDLAQCREALAESRTIREALYDMVDEELANTYLNYGNLEGAEGKEDEAIVYFERSIAIRRNIANAEVMIAVCHLTIARALLNKGDYDGCEVWMDKSEKAFVEKLGEQAHNLLFVHYLRGNLHLARGQLQEAKASYTASLNRLLEVSPTQPKVPVIYYKLGTVALRLKNYAEALEALAEGLPVARLRGEDGRGEEARILRRQAQVLEAAGPLDAGSPLLKLVEDVDPDILRGKADQLRLRLEGLGYRVCESEEEEERAFDQLVGPFDR